MSTYKLDKKMPDFIHVARIKDLFWNNNSDLYPNRVPNLNGYIRISNKKPTFQSPYLGTIVLQGEWNHAFYNNKYWFLVKLEVQDVANNVYLYQLVIDNMMNFLNEGGEIKGKLIRTNRQEILSEVVQTCQPILSDPSREIFIDTNISDFDFKKNCRLEAPTNLPETSYIYGLTNNFFNDFITGIRDDVFLKKCQKEKPKYDNSEYIKYGERDPNRNFYALSVLRPIKQSFWKSTVLNLIKHHFKTFTDKQITTQTQITGSIYNGKKAVTWETNSIGTHKESGVILEKIDLTGLEDIVPIGEDGNPLIPNTKPSIDHLIKLERKYMGYFPLVLDQAAYLPYKESWVDEDYSNIGYYKGNTSQTINVDGKKLRQWYLPINNCSFIAPNLPTWLGHGFTFNVDKQIIHESSRGYISNYFYSKVPRSKIPPLGFRIGQQLKNSNDWDKYEYTAESKITQVSIIHSLTDLSEFDNAKGKWYENIPEDVVNIWGDIKLARFNLELDFLTWLTVVSSFGNYENKLYKYFYSRDKWGIRTFLPNDNKYYTYQIIDAPLKDAVNTINNTTINAYLARRDGLIRRNLKYLAMRLSRWEINKGDIFWVDGDYSWYPIVDEKQLPLTGLSNAEFASWFIPSNPNKAFLTAGLKNQMRDLDVWLEIEKYGEDQAKNISTTSHGGTPDWFNYLYDPTIETLKKSPYFFLTPYKNLIDPDNTEYFSNDRALVFGYYKGKFGFWTYEKGSVWGLIQSEQTTSRFSHTMNLLKPTGIYIDIGTDIGNIETQKQSILEKALLHFSRSTKDGFYNWFTEKDLTSTESRIRFDLVGTKWTVIFFKGLPHLVAKDDTPFKTNVNKEITIKKEPRNETTNTIINQKSMLNFYGQTFPLNTKFKFNDEDNIEIKYRQIDTKNRVTPINPYHLTVRNNNDHFTTWVAVNKEQLSNVGAEIDPIQLEILRNQMDGNAMRYQHEVERNNTMLYKKNVEMIRRREDLDMNWWDQTVSNVTGGLNILGSGIATSAIGGKIGGVGGMVAGLSATATRAAQFAYDVYKGYRNYNIQESRLTEDKHILYAENLQAMFHRKQNYEHEYKKNLIELNGMTRSFIKQGINDVEIQKEFNRGNNLSGVYIQVLLPSEPQLTVIDHIYKTFGCECVSSKFETDPLIIESGMTEGLYQFAKLTGEGVSSNLELTSDTTVRNSIAYCFEAGVRFTETTFIYLTQDKKELPKPKEDKPTFDTKNIDKWNRETWDLYYGLTNKNDILNDLKKHANFGLTKPEIDANPIIKTTPENELVEKVNVIISNRKTGEVYIIPPKKDIQITEEQLDQLNKQIEQCNAEKTALQTQLKEEQAKPRRDEEKERQLQSDLDDKTTELNRVKSLMESQQRAITNLNTLIRGKNQQITKLKEDKTTLTRQLNECRNRRGSTDQIQQQLNNANNQIETLTAEKKTLEDNVKVMEERIKTLNTEKDTLQKDKSSIQNQLDVQKRLNEASKRVNMKCLKDKGELEKQLKGYEDTKKKLDDEIKQHKIDKEDLTQQLNNERIRSINEKDEINKLKKQCEDEKAEVERLKKECDSQVEALDEIRKAKDKHAKKVEELQKKLEEQSKSKTPVQLPIDCKTLKTILKDEYEIDIKERDNGWSALRDLVFDLAQRLNYLRSSGLDQRLMNTPQIRSIIDKLEVLEEIPLIDIAMDVIKNPNWNKYAKWVNNGGTKPTNVDDIERQIDKIQATERVSTAHMIQAILDEANYLTFVAKRDLHDEITKDSDLEVFLTHVYPGKNIELYKNLYGEPEIAVIRKRFNKEVTCHSSGDTITSQEILDEIKRTTTYENIFVSPRPSDPIDPNKSIEGNKLYAAKAREVVELRKQLAQCKSSPFKRSVGTINDIFPKSEGYTITPNKPNPTQDIIYKWREKGKVPFINDWWKNSPRGEKEGKSGSYYYIYYRSDVNTYRGGLYVYKPWTKLRLNILFIQNLINCLHDYVHDPDRLYQWLRRDNEELIRIYADKEDYLYHKFSINTFYGGLMNVSNKLFRVVVHEDDYGLADVIVNALLRTTGTLEIIKEGSYFNTRLKELPDRTTSGVPIFIFNPYIKNTSSNQTFYQFILECIYILRNNPWKTAYPEIMGLIRNWEWINWE